MGDACSACCDDKTVNREDELRAQHPAGAPSRPAVLIPLKVDIKNEQVRSYKILGENEYLKNVYNWHAIPVSTTLNLNDSSSFGVASLGIKDDNFVIGVIKKSAVTGVTKMPWKTNNAICFESHSKPGESGVIFNKDINRSGRGLRRGEEMVVTVSKGLIEFHIGKERVGFREIPAEFLNDEICPYIALFTDGDRVRLLERTSS